MDTVQRIAKNIFSLFSAQIICLGLGFFYTMYMARYLGAESFGILSFSLAITAIFGVFTDIGMTTLTTKEVSKNELLAEKYLSNTLLMKIILSIITFIFITSSLNLIGCSKQTEFIVYIIFLSVIFNSFSNTFYSIFQAYEKMEYQSLGQGLNSTLMYSGILLAISQRLDVIHFSMIYLLVSIIVFITNFGICLRKFVKPHIKIDFTFLKKTLKESLPFGISSIFIVIYYYIDSVMLSIMIPNGDEVVGWYNAAYRMVLVLLIIPSMYTTAVFPIMSKLHKTSENTLKFVLEKSLKYILILCIPIVTWTILLSDRIILLTFGIEYSQSIIILKILVWSFLFASIGGIFGYLLNSINKQGTLTKIVGIGAILNIVLNLMFIPEYSYVGASLATDFTRLIVIYMEFIVLSKIGYRLQNKILLNILFKSVASSLIMGTLIIFMHNVNFILTIFVSMISYIVTLYVLCAFDEEDLRLFRSLYVSAN